VLIRHVIRKKNDKGEADGEPFPLYSLYMHLDAPKWDSENDYYKSNVPWFKKINDFQYGGVVNVDPSSAAFGETQWAVKPVDAGAASVTVTGGSQVPLQKDGRTLGIAKPVSEDVTEAISAFKMGCVTTFSEPVLPVGTGEVIGCAKGPIHWEMFSPFGEQGGIQKLIAIDPELSKVLSSKIEELESDNFFDMKDAQGKGTDEFKEVLLGALPADDRSDLEGVINEWTYAEKLIAFYKKTNTFSKDGPDQASTQDLFTYPVTFKLTNPFDFKISKPVEVMVSFTAEEKNVGKTGKLEVTSFDNEYSIHVPAQADMVHFDCADFFLESVSVNELSADSQKKSAESAFFGDITRFRWRGSRIGHLSEWSTTGTDALLNKLKEKNRLDTFIAMARDYREFLESKKLVSAGAAKFDLFKTLIRFATWWGRERSDSDPWGEVAVVGQGSSVTSLFGGDASRQLPPDAKVDNLHPVTCLWLLELLHERSRIEVLNKWDPVTILGTDQTESALYRAVASEKNRLGTKLQAVLVDDGYENGIPINFQASFSGGGKIPLGNALSVYGTAHWLGRANVWGDWELEVTRGDGSIIETNVGDATISIAMPEGVAELTVSAPKPKTRLYTGCITATAHAPSVMEAFLFFESCTATGSAAPDFALAVIPPVCIPVKLIPAKVNLKKTNNGIQTDGVYLLPTNGVKKVRIIKGGKFTFGELFDAYVGSKEDFKLNLVLYNKLELVRGKGEKPQIVIDSIADGGCSIVIRSFTGKEDELKKIQANASNLNGKDGLIVETVGDMVKMTVPTPPETPVVMEFAFGLTAPLGALVNSVDPPQGSLVHTRPLLLAPNGGHALLGDASGNEYEEVAIAVLKQKCGNDYLEVRSEFSFPPVGKLAASEMNVVLGDKIHTSVTLFGNIKDWQKVGPLIQIEYGKSKSCSGKLDIKNNVLSEDWSLKSERLNKQLAFSVVLTKPEAVLAQPVLPVVKYFDFKPAIGSFTVEESDGMLVLRGKGVCIPPSTMFEIKCKVVDKGVESGDTALKKTIDYKYDKYDKSRNNFGGCDENGNFEATLDRSAIKDVKKRKFIWRLAPGITIGDSLLPEQMCEYVPSKAEQD